MCLNSRPHAFRRDQRLCRDRRPQGRGQCRHHARASAAGQRLARDRQDRACARASALRWHVEPVRLFKIFPPLPPTQPATHQHGAPERVTQLLEAQLAELKSALADMRQDRDRWTAEAADWKRQAQNLLSPPHQSAPLAQPTHPAEIPAVLQPFPRPSTASAGPGAGCGRRGDPMSYPMSLSKWWAKFVTKPHDLLGWFFISAWLCWLWIALPIMSTLPAFAALN